MKHLIKINRACRLGHWHKGPNTQGAVLAQLPQQLLGTLTSRDIALVCDAINTAYHNGKASCGCEVIDGEAIFINKLGNLYELEDIAKLQLAIGSR